MGRPSCTCIAWMMHLGLAQSVPPLSASCRRATAAAACAPGDALPTVAVGTHGPLLLPQKLLGALQAATRVVELLGGAGAARAELEALCSTFLADVQDSQARAGLCRLPHSAPFSILLPAGVLNKRASCGEAYSCGPAALPRGYRCRPQQPLYIRRPPLRAQVTLLELADRHQQPLPFQNNDYRQHLELLAAQLELKAAEAQLAAAAAGAGGAAGAAAPAAGGAPR